MRVVAASDKFRSTASAREVTEAVGAAAATVGWDCDQVPMADGGDGLLDVLGGPNRTATVRGPLGDPVEAAWRLHDGTAVIEMARASGLLLAGGADGNDPIAADTHGTGQLVRLAIEAGAHRIIVGLGGSATTDGGLAALSAIGTRQRFRAVDVEVACDVRTRFLDAAEVFGPQKGASKAQVRLLANRLARLAAVYEEDHGVDVTVLSGSGAAGGLAGGLAAYGARLVEGTTLVAEELGLDEVIEGADLVVTGEGFLDEASFDGKVVGGVTNLARSLGVPVVAVVGDTVDEEIERVAVAAGVAQVISLVDRFGRDRAMADTVACIASAVAEVLTERS